MSEITIRMPRSTIEAHTSPRTIGELVMSLERYMEQPEATKRFYPWANRFVMGFPVPDWQRPLVWSNEQKIRIIESIWNSVDTGTYLINIYDSGIVTTASGEVETLPFTDCILDGQQRLSAIEDYVLDKIAVEDATGTPRLFSELPLKEKRRFRNSTFSRSSVSTNDEIVLRKIYDLRSFGGVAHTEDQRASESQEFDWLVRQRFTEG